ncbi:VOC family protein [Legionella sp. km772]|uniref:VOC family protein n=1 Tax=Legionella sp. km772 TaxID=2498111 RepID=UPI000F8D3CDA|nr:VOC family protein [Legionella sp. km772]RUR08456.1 VOC family protein [Legionella sp. km772]
MKFGYTIIYVDDVRASLNFFEQAFGLKIRFYHDSGYGELETGNTTLAFASHALGANNLPEGYIATNESVKPLGIEIVLITDSVPHAHQQAVMAGGISLQDPVDKPWGQTVSYIRCPDGTLVELCSPVSN